VQGLLGRCLALEIDEYYFPLLTHRGPTPTANGGGGKSEYNKNSGLGKGVGIGIGVGALLAVAAVGGIFWWFRKRTPKGYDAAGFDAATYTIP
jgi:hypothetical protein